MLFYLAFFDIIFTPIRILYGPTKWRLLFTLSCGVNVLHVRQFVLELCRLENVLKNHEIEHFDIVFKCNVVFEHTLQQIITLYHKKV